MALCNVLPMLQPAHMNGPFGIDCDNFFMRAIAISPKFGASPKVLLNHRLTSSLVTVGTACNICGPGKVWIDQ